jgi:xylulokinase
MTLPAVIGIDVGGSATKAAVYSLNGALLGLGLARYKPAQPAPGVAEYDPASITRAVESSLRDAIRAAAIDPRAILSITVAAMVSGAIGIDVDGRPTTAYTTTLDTRFNPDLEAMITGYGREIRDLVGSGTPVIAAKIAWYRRTQPEVFTRTSAFIGAGGFVGGHLAGLTAAEAFIDPTVLWAVGLSDTRSRTWSPRLLASLDVPLELLPNIVDSTTVIGALTAEVAQRTGLTTGTPVVAGCGDQMAGFLGANVIGENTIGDSVGTYEVVGRGVDDFLAQPDDFFDIVPSAVGVGYVQQSVVAIGGGFTRAWFESKIATDWTSGQQLDLDGLAEDIPIGSDGVLFVPHLGGQSSPSRPWLRGAWFGLEWTHHKGHLTRSILEAMAYEVATAVDGMVPQGPSNHRLVGYGGGVQSALSCQIKADVTGLPYESLGDIAPASLAAALIGAVAVGTIEDIAPIIQAKSRIVTTFVPDVDRSADYSQFRRDYADAVELTAQLRRR